MKKKDDILSCLDGMVNAFLRANGPKAVDCKLYPEYEKALIVLVEYDKKQR